MAGTRDLAAAPRGSKGRCQVPGTDLSRFRDGSCRAAGYRGQVDPLDGLNPEQRRAAEAVRGPVCILAGAGSGKTTTITRRVAQQVATDTFAANQVMAVTFTDKAANELKARA